MNRLAPVIFVDAIEPNLPFWTERLEFIPTAEVPDGDRLGFVILKWGNVEVMYQSRSSVAEDIPALAEGDFARSGGSLFLDVPDIQYIVDRMEGIEPVVPLRDTFYGSRELGVRAPCGTMVLFAQMQAQG